jgi:flotillin
LGLGLEIISYTVRDISDKMNYLDTLGKSRTAQVKTTARIGEAAARRDGVVSTSETKVREMQGYYESEIGKAESKKNYDLAQARNKIQVDTQKTAAEMSAALSAARVQQRIKAEELDSELANKSKEVEIANEEVTRTWKEQQSTVIQPAQAEAYRIVQIADGNKLAFTKQAAAEAQELTLSGEQAARPRIRLDAVSHC